MKTIILDPRTWIRGKQPRTSMLRTSDGLLCCMGFYSRSCGYTDEEITHVLTMSGLYLYTPRRDGDAWDDAIFLDEHVYQINDADGLTDKERVRQLNKIVAPHGFRFVLGEDGLDKPPTYHAPIVGYEKNDDTI